MCNEAVLDMSFNLYLLGFLLIVQFFWETKNMLSELGGESVAAISYT